MATVADMVDFVAMQCVPGFTAGVGSTCRWRVVDDHSALRTTRQKPSFVKSGS